MIAGALKLCGLYLGTNLITGLHDNPKGHFEDRAFVRINAEIIEQNAGKWSQPPDRITTWPEMERKMKSFAQSWPKDRVVGWKDPRACLTVHLWRKAIEPEELRAVLVLRPVQEIALSLKKRNGFPFQKSRKLTRLYMEKAKKNLKEIPYIETHYHRYFNGWREELKKVCSFLGLSIQHESSINRFIDRRLWHCRENEQEKRAAL